MFIRLLILLLFANAGICASQDCLDSILLGEPYSNSNNIINGRKWIYEKKYYGTPLLTGDFWPEATISYNGVVYNEVLMNFDVSKNEIIIYYPEKEKEKYVVLFSEYLSEFSFLDTLMKRDRFFELKELPGTDGKDLYENISSGNISFYIKPVKKIVVGSTGKSRGSYENLYEYYIKTETGYSGFRKKNQLINLLGNYGNDAKSYIKKNRIKINNQDPEGVIAVINYLGKRN